MLATVLGQDLEAGEDGRFRIARKVARDRVISTVDPDARHGHKTQARGFDGYKGHVAVDPDSEIITDTIVTPGNAGDASVATDLIDDLLDDDDRGDDAKVYGDSAYGTGEFQQRLDDERHRLGLPDPAAVGAGRPVRQGPLRRRPRRRHRHLPRRGDRDRSAAAPTATASPTSPSTAPPVRCAPSAPTPPGAAPSASDEFEAALARARQRQTDPDWQADYRANRPKVERKLAHLMRRRHGGRRARVRGRPKVDADFNLLAAAANLARLAALGLRSTTTGWAVTA